MTPNNESVRLFIASHYRRLQILLYYAAMSDKQPFYWWLDAATWQIMKKMPLWSVDENKPAPPVSKEVQDEVI